MPSKAACSCFPTGVRQHALPVWHRCGDAQRYTADGEQRDEKSHVRQMWHVVERPEAEKECHERTCCRESDAGIAAHPAADATNEVRYTEGHSSSLTSVG